MQTGKLFTGAFRGLLALLALTAAAGAQAASGDRGGSMETRLSLLFNNSWSVEGDQGTFADIKYETGFGIGFAYNQTNKLAFGGQFEWDSPDYDARVLLDNSVGADFPFDVRGEAENLRLLFDGTYHFSEGQFSPFISAILGWTWTDTNIATEPPQTGCWWDPWWGYICTTWQDTRTADGFTYGAAAGARFDFNRQFAISATYRILWTQYGGELGTPDTDGFTLNFLFKF